MTNMSTTLIPAPPKPYRYRPPVPARFVSEDARWARRVRRAPSRAAVSPPPPPPLPPAPPAPPAFARVRPSRLASALTRLATFGASLAVPPGFHRRPALLLA